MIVNADRACWFQFAQKKYQRRSGKKTNPQRLPLECRARALVHAAMFVRGPDCPDDVSVMLKRTSIAAGPRLRTNSLVPHSINDTT
jgi:hypothetical protein